jgi:glyoxylase-like metal-dependent hydrolase (beta-lactamase superfamily II)
LPLEVTPLGSGALLLTSELWATNSLLVPAGDACVLCDPSIFPDELDRIRSATRSYGRVYVLVTHSDFDHVCGVPWFPEATVVAGPSTAAAIADGTARRKLDDSGRDWGIHWDGELRVDAVLGDEELLGIRAIDARGHIDDGSAFVLVERRMLLAGDYLSAVCYPVLLGSLAQAASSYERLVWALDEYDISVVVPGHGPTLSRAEARRIAREDLEYIRALERAAAGAHADLSDLLAVEPPRPARRDFEALGLLEANARRALAEAAG